MPLPAYQVAILDRTFGTVKAIFDASSFYDLRYSRNLNDVGTLAITLPSTLDIRNLFTLDTFIEVYREDVAGDLQREETYLTRLTHRFIEGDEERFVVGGVSLNHLLMRRIVDPALVSANGYSAKSGAADQVIYDYCLEQAGLGASVARQTPGLILVAPAGIGLTVNANLRYQNLFTEVQKLAKTGAVDFAISRTTATGLSLAVGVIGSDKTYGTNFPLGLPWVGLSPLRGNLTLPSLLTDRKTEANYAYALGQGQAEDRVLLEISTGAETDSPFNRIEIYVDARNVSMTDLTTLASQANQALDGKRAVTEFTFKPTGTEPGNVYHIDWDLGDAVTVTWDEITDDFRITDVEISISAQGETIKATVSDNYVFPNV